MTPTAPVDAARMLRDAVPAPLWTDRLAPPPSAPPLAGHIEADLVVVGGGYTGLWTALLALEADPGRDVVLLEAATCGWAASGRNGGFCSSSLTHGLANGLSRWPNEMALLERLGAANLDEIETSLAGYAIECEAERTGDLTLAVAPWQLEELRELHVAADRLDLGWRWLDAEAAREQVASQTYLGGYWDPTGTLMLDPARLAQGLRAAAIRAGVILHEHTPVHSVERDGAGVRVTTPVGSVHARQVVVATNAYRSPVARHRAYIAPVWDYALATEPLPADVRASLGWQGRQGVSDAGNQFHYYRLTADDRVVWGGYDAVWFPGGDTGRRREQRPATYEMLARHLVQTFPQLADVAITHTWGGVVDTCTRFSAFWAPAVSGRVVSVAGYTGLGVGASRFGAAVALDLLAGRDTEATGLEMVRRRPLPFPPEPLRTIGIELTRWSIARADARGGRRNLWLRAMDAAGLGFDS